MGLFDRLFGKKENALDKGLPDVQADAPEMPKIKKPRKPKVKKEEPTLSAKQIATAAGEPYVAITKIELDPTNINDGAFELDWNDKFVLNLIKAGYKQRDDDTDQRMVERWFEYTCRNVALSLYEQQISSPDNRDLRNVRTRDIGDGRVEVS